MSENYTKSPLKVDRMGGYLFARSVGSACMEENDFMFAQIRGWGHLKYLGEDVAEEIQDANLERLAAAWNAVQGIPTEVLESEAFQDAVRQLRGQERKPEAANPLDRFKFNDEIHP